MRHRLHPLVTVVLAGSFAAALFAQAGASGQINGLIEDPDGKPIPQANVAILVRPPALPTDPFQPFNAEVTTDANGKFNVTGVPAGRYAVCVSVPNSNLLPPCAWERPSLVALATGQTLSLAPIRLKKGVDLYVRVNDLSGTEAAKEGRVAGASLLLGVRVTNGPFVHIPRTASDTKGFDHHLFVPPATDLSVIAFSQAFTLLDSSGAAVDKQAGISRPVNIPASQAQHMEEIDIK